MLSKFDHIRTLLRNANTDEKTINTVLQLAGIDPLTQIPNREATLERLHHETHKAARYHYPLSLILADLDHFSDYNNTYGHLQGDLALHHAAQRLTRTIRDCADTLGRYGGEEFLLLFPHTNEQQLTIIGNRLVHLVRTLTIPHTADITNIDTPYTTHHSEDNHASHTVYADTITISAGGTTTHPTTDTSIEHLIAHADQALYRSKETGRNTFTLFTG